MSKLHAKITGLGKYLPERILSNADLEKMVDTSDEWITKRVGIKERRISDDATFASDLAAKAAENRRFFSMGGPPLYASVNSIITKRGSSVNEKALPGMTKTDLIFLLDRRPVPCYT